MEEVFKRISQYQIFNFLLSGTILAFLISKTTTFNLLYENILIAIFIYYFLGFIASRIGSLIIEPLFKALRIVKYASYKEYVSAVKKDKKIDVLSQENNTYRTLIGTLLIYSAVYGLFLIFGENALQQSWVVFTVAALLVVLLVLAYRKQTKYIVLRVDAANK